MGRSNKSKIMFLCTGDRIGGTEQMVLTLSRAFAARDCAVSTIFPQISDPEPVLKWGRDQGVEIEMIPSLLDIFALHRSFRYMLKLRQFIKSRKPDVVNIHFGGNFISAKDVLAIRLAGIHKCIVTVNHPGTWINTPEFQQKKRMTGLAAYLAHNVVAISQATRRTLIEAGVPENKITVIPCGVQAPKRLAQREEARKRLGLARDSFVIASVARLTPSKGLDTLIRAVGDIPDPRQELSLVIAGEGPERSNLELIADARLQGRAIFLGRLPDVNDLFASADIFVLPSHMEGFGLVYVEAAFHAVPSIGTDVGGIPDAIAHGKTGLLVPLDDVSSLTKAIQHLRDNPESRTRMGLAAQERANSEFSEKRLTESYAALFRIC